MDECKALKLGMLLFSILHVSFANFAELTFSVEQKYVAYKHLDMKLFPPFSYIASWQGLRSSQDTSNGGRQFLRNGRSNRHIVPFYGKSDRLFTQGLKFETR